MRSRSGRGGCWSTRRGSLAPAAAGGLVHHPHDPYGAGPAVGSLRGRRDPRPRGPAPPEEQDAHPRLRAMVGADGPAVTRARVAAARRGYHAAIRLVDEHVVTLLETLDGGPA